MNLMQITDLVIVGAGSAGLSAGKVAAERGLKVVILDEFPTPGGRMLGQFHEEPNGTWWIGRQVVQQLLTDIESLNISIHCATSVHGLELGDRGWTVFTPQQSFQSKYLLLATGAAEVPTPIPGWTLPGVMSIGAAQVMTNVHRVKPGRKGMVVGVNVLGMAIARELSVSGIDICGIVLPPENIFTGEGAKPAVAMEFLAGFAHMAPSPLLRMGGRLAKNPTFAKMAAGLFPRQGLPIWDIPLRLRTAVRSINGTNHVESVTLIDIDGNGRPIVGSEREEVVDFVAIAGGLYPLAELASVAGCSFVYMRELGGYVPVHNGNLQTEVKNLYVAGNITGVESALVAMAQGRLAAISICEEAGILGPNDPTLNQAKESLRATRKNAPIQFHPGITEARNKLYQS